MFLGTILTDLPLPSASTPAPDCPGCNACIRACPSGALTETGCDVARCLSDLTQKKGTLTAEQKAQLQAHPLIWGCDFCQLACPYNRDAQVSPLPELTGQTEETPLSGFPVLRGFGGADQPHLPRCLRQSLLRLAGAGGVTAESGMEGGKKGRQIVKFASVQRYSLWYNGFTIKSVVALKEERTWNERQSALRTY